ncbi:MAG TPA: Omp28 family outer membrane lipoprotein [Bacteroidales bacterium]|nr:Omp28 family outer membrane lipoprotein [Bacteroidales bacterium]
MKTIQYFFLTFIALSFLIACDEVEAPYLIEVGGADTSVCPVPDFPHIHDPVKRVLLEDYTGHTCVNCPTAAKLAHDLKDALGDKLVVIAVHAGFFSWPMAGDYAADFRTEAGTEWDNLFGISKVGNPNGMVDRVGYSTAHILSPGAWSDKINQQLAREPELVVQVINEYTDTERKLCSHVQVTFLRETLRNLNLSLVITEDEIVAPQKNNNPDIGTTPDIMDYHHDHLLRGAINTPWGISISTKEIAVEEDTEMLKTYKYVMDAAWDPYKCRVIAFVYDVDTREVLQVYEATVI